MVRLKEKLEFSKTTVTVGGAHGYLRRSNTSRSFASLLVGGGIESSGVFPHSPIH